MSLLPGLSFAQATGDPIPDSAPIAPWTIVLEDVVQIPGPSNRLEWLTGNPTTGLTYVVRQDGNVFSFDPTAPTPVASLFLDLNATVGGISINNESGARGLAFHPDFDAVGSGGYRKMYVAWSRTAASVPVGNPVVFDSPGTTDHYTVVSEWTLDAAGAVDLGSYRELMRIEQPFGNHNGGHLGFDPTATPASPEYGLLFISVGDGGSAGGPFDLSQDIDATPVPYPHGKILRIDPLAGSGTPYSIPTDNPFAGVADRLEETWAFGLRNPHKFMWDEATGKLYVSDIGQGVVEEISVVAKQANLGWNEREGAYVYENGSSVSPLPAGHPTDAFTYPVAQYDHSSNGINGSSAIVGGPVYRGTRIPELLGMYFFADFASNPGPIFAVRVDQLIERDDFTNLEIFAGGRLAAFEEVRISDAGVDKTFRDFLRDANADPGINRTDARWGVGSDGEIYLLNKRDGMVRRIADVVGLSPPVPAVRSVGFGALAGFVAVLGGLRLRRRSIRDRAVSSISATPATS